MGVIPPDMIHPHIACYIHPTFCLQNFEEQQGFDQYWQQPPPPPGPRVPGPNHAPPEPPHMHREFRSPRPDRARPPIHVHHTPPPTIPMVEENSGIGWYLVLYTSILKACHYTGLPVEPRKPRKT